MKPQTMLILVLVVMLGYQLAMIIGLRLQVEGLKEQEQFWMEQAIKH